MISVVSTDYGVDTILVRSRLNRVLRKIGSAAMVVTVNVLPCLSVDERKLIWSEADNRAVALVKFFNAMSQVTSG